jgi:hypothetical protein
MSKIIPLIKINRHNRWQLENKKDVEKNLHYFTYVNYPCYEIDHI